MFDPWFKSNLTSVSLGKSLNLGVPFDVFSTQRIDEGTNLFLNHLPKSEPHHILDMGCGYGALGLPIAAAYPNAKIEMVDRDLLAASWSAKNAQENNLINVDAHGSLGFRDVKRDSYDWILCNIPARIGTPFIKNFMEVSSTLLTEHGEVSVVVITDLGPVMKELKKELNWPLVEVAVGPRHTIFSMKKFGSITKPIDPLELYLRDEVQVENLELMRPFDIGGDDQKRLQSSLPILLDMMPRKALPKNSRILCFRTFYGALPLVASKRYPDSEMIAIDRDLLGTTYMRANAENLELGARLEIREAPSFPEGIKENEKFDLILGELSSSAGERVAIQELKKIYASLAKEGQALIVCLDKIEKDWVKTFSEKTKIHVQKALTREHFTVIRMTN